MKAMILEFSTNSFGGWNTCSSAIADSSFGESLLRKDYILRNRPAGAAADKGSCQMVSILEKARVSSKQPATAQRHVHG
jgi:hypothetical protein